MKKGNVLKKGLSLLGVIVLFVQILTVSGIFTYNHVYAESDLQISEEGYNTLLNELQLILNEKKFGNEINEIIIDGMKSLWDSYDNIYYSYSAIGYPEKEKYIRDNYIKGIKKVGYIRLMSNEEIEFQPGVVAYVSADENGVPYMCLKYKPEDEYEYNEYLNTLQHEVRHIIQDENWNDKVEEYRYMLRTSAEGWAVLGELNKYKNNNAQDICTYYNESKTDENNNYVKIGGIGSTTEYALLPNAILKLTIIVGYDNMYKFETGEITYDELLEILEQKLGNETYERFIDDLKTSFLNYDRDYSVPGFEAFWFNEGTDYDKIFDAENIVLNVLESKISNANSKEEIQALFNFYYIYKKYYCVKYEEIIETVIDENENNITIDRNITDKSCEKLIIEEIENLLIDKAIQYKAVAKVSDNVQLNKMALKSLFAEPNPPSAKYTGCINLEEESYIYTENEENDLITGNLKTNGTDTKFTVDNILDSTFLYQPDRFNTPNKIMKYTSKNNEKHIKEIKITQVPNKTTYIQNVEELDLYGGRLQIVYDDQTKEELSLTNENVKVTHFDNTNTGNIELTVEYQGKETTFSVEIINKENENINPINNVVEKWTDISNVKIKIDNNKILADNLNRKENHYYYFWIVDDEKDLLQEKESFMGLTREQVNSVSLVNIGDDISYWLDMDIKNVKCQLVEEDNDQDGITKVIINNFSLDELVNGKKVEKEENQKDEKDKDQKENDTVIYKIIEGANQIYKGKGNLIIKSNGDIKKFVKLEIDDKDVSKDYYSLKSGSTIIELKETFLANLNKGKHEITFVYEDGKVSTKFEIVNDTKDGTQAKISLPQTGDKIGLILVIAIISAGVFVITRKRKEI